MEYLIKNNLCEAIIEQKGAQLKSFKIGERELIWKRDENYWNESAPILFPFIGKTIGYKYSYGGNSYDMTFHGFASQMNFVAEVMEDDRIILVLRENEATSKIYPFAFELRVEFRLEADELVSTYSVYNRDDKEIIFSLGLHPGFNVGEDFYLEFDKDENQNARKIISKFVGKPEGYKLSGKIIDNVEEAVKEHVTLLFEDLNSDKVYIKNIKNNEKISVSFEGFKYLAIWKAENAPFVAVEPWAGIPDLVDGDGVLETKEGVTRLGVNDHFKVSMRIGE